MQMNLDLRNSLPITRAHFLGFIGQKNLHFSTKRRGIEVSRVTFYPVDPGSIPGASNFSLSLSKLVLQLVLVQNFYFLLVNRLADMATPDAAVREVPGSNPVHV